MAKSREASYLQDSLSRRSDVARCGVVAALLYLQGRLVCDNYGRLDARPIKLLDEVLQTIGHVNRISIEDIRLARDALVREGAWYFYVAHGCEFVEYVDFDREQRPDFLMRRGANEHPDPPDRPDLWYQNRPHRPTKDEKNGSAAGSRTPGPTSQSPPGGAVPPEGHDTPVPSGEDDAVGVQGHTDGDRRSPLKQTAEYREYERACRDGHMDGWLTDTAVDQFYSVTVGCGREFGVMAEVAKEAALSARDKVPSVHYGLGILRRLPSEIRTQADAKEHFEAKARFGRLPPGGAQKQTPKAFASLQRRMVEAQAREGQS